MWKMFGWLWKAAAAALLASFLAIWTTGYIVNSYVEALLEEYEIPLEKPPFALSGLWGRLWGVNGAGGGLVADREPIGGFEDARNWSGGDRREPDAGRAGGGLSDDAGQPDASGDGPDGSAGGEEPANSEYSGDGDTSADTETTGFGKGPEARGGAGETVISTEELLEAKSRLTDDERNRLFAILVGKVPQEEWQRISAFAEGGLTADELLKVQQIVAAYLDREEYDELMGILNKF